MDIGDQYAKGDIYNIGKIDLNGGTLNADKIYIKGSSDEVELFTKQNQDALRAQFDLSYLDFIVADNQKKFLIDRPLVNEILSKLEENHDLPLIGIPGVGKTCILFQLSKDLPNVIYVPLKGKSLLTVVSHLINKINLASGLPLISLIDAEAGLEILQGQLVTSKMTVMLDDCESNPTVTERLLSLRKLENKFIYASRNEQLFRAKGIETIPVGTFSFDEVKNFLAGSQIDLDVLATNELFEASNGNPLYLYYFTQYQIKPLPKDINDYHHAIWGGLDARQQQCLIFIALSYRPIKPQVIYDLIPFDFPTEAALFINSLIALIKNENGQFEIFHPAFKEYIVDWLRFSGLLDQYQKQLGEYYLKNNELLQAAYLLIDIVPNALEKIANNIVYQLIAEGDLTFATRVMLVMLELRKTNFEKGYLHYHLSFNFKMLNENEKADYHQDQALFYFNKLKRRSWYNAALMNQAISLVEDGRTEEGLAIADKVLQRSSQFGSDFEGQLLVNISKIYVEIHENEKAAKAAFKAYQSFEKLEHAFGMLSSMTNLASALAKMDDYHDLSAEYALKVLEYSKLGISFNLELIALNILTSINRVKGNYKQAKEYGHKAVMLCQHYKLENKAILNLVNYGNVLRDAGEIDGALKVYHEALIAANKVGLTKDESRIYWIISDIALEKRNFEKALEYIDTSIDKAKSIGYQYGIAHGHQDKAKIYHKKGELKPAAENYAISAATFGPLADFAKERSRVLQKAILLYLELDLKDEANELFKNAAGILQHVGFYEFKTLINDAKNDLDIHSYFKHFTSSYTKLTDPVNLTMEYLMYLEYCLRNTESSKAHFNALLRDLATATVKNRFVMPILALLLEQSKRLTNGVDLKVLLQLLTVKLTGFNAREIVHETILLIKLSNGIKLEIVMYTEDWITVKLGIAQSLFFINSPDLLELEKARKQDFCKIQIFMLRDFRKLFTKINIPTNDDRFLTYHLPKHDFDVPNFIVVNEKYEGAADLTADFNNKHFMYFLGIAIRNLIANFYHLKNSSVHRMKLETTRKLAYMLGLTGLEEIKAQKEAYGIDLRKLDTLVKNELKKDGRLG
jgi:hypothetical protein